MKYELKYIQPTSIIISSIPVVLFCLGLLGSLIYFFILPNPYLTPMTIMQKLMATGLTALLVVLLWMAIVIVVTILYNFFTQVVGMRGLKLEMEEIAEEERSLETNQSE